MLFKDSNTVKLYAHLTGELDLFSIKRTMQTVEDKYLLPVLGKELYTAFTTAYTAAADDAAFNLDATNAKLLDQCRRVTGPLFCYHFVPKTDVQVSDSGVQRTETATNKTAFQYQNTNYREENFSEGQNAIEMLIQFLEDNTADYTRWADSKEFKKYRSLFIKTAADFSDLYPSATPYRNYWAFRAKILDVEENQIRPFLGDVLFDALKLKDQDTVPSFSNYETLLLFKLKKAIAYFSVAFSVPFIAVNINENGISSGAKRVLSSNDKTNTLAGAEDKAITHLINSCNDSGQAWLLNAAAFITSNPTIFTTWIGFSEKIITTPVSINADLTGVFGI